MSNSDRHLDELLKLPPAERAKLGHALLDSLDDEAEDLTAETANLAEWIRRLEEFESGKVAGEDVDVVIARVRSQLEAKRRT